MADFIAHFSIIPDHRINRCKKYLLIEILFLCMVAVIADAGGWGEIEDFGIDRRDWLRKFLPYDNGIPALQSGPGGFLYYSGHQFAAFHQFTDGLLLLAGVNADEAWRNADGFDVVKIKIIAVHAAAAGVYLWG